MSIVKHSKNTRENRSLRVQLEPVVLPVKPVEIGWGSQAKQRAGMPARLLELRLRQEIINGKARGVVAVLMVARLKRNGDVSATGETAWQLTKREEDWSLRRTFEPETIDYIFELLSAARKEWEAIDWEKVGAP